MEKTIQLDCWPGSPRPDTYLPVVLADTELKPKDPAGMQFGEWTWDYSEVEDSKWTELQPIFKERITDLYNQGYIRYGSW